MTNEITGVEKKTAKGRFKKPKEKNFKCTGYPGCEMSFSRAEHLARHIRRHTGEKPFKCDICLKYFSRIDNLKQHKDTVHAKDNVKNNSQHHQIHVNGAKSSNITLKYSDWRPRSGTFSAANGVGNAAAVSRDRNNNFKNRNNNMNGSNEDSMVYHHYDGNGYKNGGIDMKSNKQTRKSILKDDKRKRSYSSDNFSTSSSSSSSSPPSSNGDSCFSAGITNKNSNGGSSGSSSASNGRDSTFRNVAIGGSSMANLLPNNSNNEGNTRYGKYWSPPVMMGPNKYDGSNAENSGFTIYKNFPSERNQRYKESFSRRNWFSEGSQTVAQLPSVVYNGRDGQNNDYYSKVAPPLFSGNMNNLPHITDFYKGKSDSAEPYRKSINGRRFSAPYVHDRLHLQPNLSKQLSTPGSEEQTRGSAINVQKTMESPPYLIPVNNEPLMVSSFSGQNMSGSNNNSMNVHSNGCGPLSGAPSTMITTTATVTPQDGQQVDSAQTINENEDIVMKDHVQRDELQMAKPVIIKNNNGTTFARGNRLPPLQSFSRTDTMSNPY
ncbi:Nutrient and stress factor 1 [Nakaseomyces glabratus]|uniref:Nutrient and stress factor 1 n=1 Tax=Candida glabrata TaxID=5478 RepID=A0A0W0CJ96_CANGB|nr:Nutrient and stress factor 1 [Nakaseomyces glabratus]KTB00990.1 Nutrient and stress factor 1 [Nakaseomyces glabratus]KTB03761.1 Nutrient and stress factor 1 [Nakaseomyces glabratus]KTB22002.1 Nutrient and stress factor 1 [Nakaseomyces glabratus]